MCVGLILFSLTITLKASINMLFEKILKLQSIAESKFFSKEDQAKYSKKKKKKILSIKCFSGF